MRRHFSRKSGFWGASPLVALVIALSAFAAACNSAPAPRRYGMAAHSELIDFTEVRIQSAAGKKIRLVFKNNIAFLELSLNYRNAGFNVIESIKSGKIARSKFSVINQRGEEIALDESINFQAFLENEDRSIKTERKLFSTKGGDGIVTEASAAPWKYQYTYTEKTYDDSEDVPVFIRLKKNKVPAPGEYISVLLELDYLEPFYDEACDADKGKTPGALFRNDCPDESTLKRRKMSPTVFFDIFGDTITKRNEIQLERVRKNMVSFGVKKADIMNRISETNYQLKKAVSEDEKKKLTDILGKLRTELRTHEKNSPRFSEPGPAAFKACRALMQDRINGFNNDAAVLARIQAEAAETTETADKSNGVSDAEKTSDGATPDFDALAKQCFKEKDGDPDPDDGEYLRRAATKSIAYDMTAEQRQKRYFRLYFREWKLVTRPYYFQIE